MHIHTLACMGEKSNSSKWDWNLKLEILLSKTMCAGGRGGSWKLLGPGAVPTCAPDAVR